MRRFGLVAALLLAGCAASPPEGKPQDPGFVLLGDVPYSQPHANLLDGMIDRINRQAPALVVHLGDITGGNGPCTDAWFEARARQFARFSAPFVLLPGDNEWTDCHRTGYDPLERLAKVRKLFHSQAIALPEFARQSAARPEHVRWVWDATVFVGLNVPGSNNNLGRTAAMDEEYAARMFAVAAWLREAEQLASAPRIRALVVMMQADPDFEERRRAAGLPDGYAGLRAALAETARRLGKPLIVAHGDTHQFRHDRPMAGVPNLTRIEVDGWPWLGWLLVHVQPGAASPVRVERTLHP
ncbi:MAG: hypothetical protein JSS40_11660 [Proteobacteria bacterium]|nr:hypothetical protein [Pseudomonadota bacterium]